jgi:hypothetical protein
MFQYVLVHNKGEPMLRRTVKHAFVAVVIMLAMLSQGTWALAGTTGNITGQVTDTSTGKPVPGAQVQAVSPSQSASSTTDASGHFSFLGLAPDTYTVSVQKDGYTPVSLSDVTVFADQTQTVVVPTHSQLRTIARVTSRAAGALVKFGTTADVYSVNAATAAKASALGGGSALNQAYSAVASVPGVYVPVGSSGWNQTVLIRGGDYDQVGFEYDGVPVNRSFDNYPAHTASALGQQEVEVYTGSSPANAESTGLAGFINQVIKTGTYPGFGDADLSIGTPSFYHKASVEAGGANPGRTFSYYAGIGGYNSSPRMIDNGNGGAYWNQFGPVYWELPCDAAGNAALEGCYLNSGAGSFGGFFATPDGGPVGPGNGLIQGAATTGTAFSTFGYLPTLTDRDFVANFHFGINHKHDAGRDDVQLLYSNSMLNSTVADSAADWGWTRNPADQAALEAACPAAVYLCGAATFGPNGEFPALPTPSSFHYTGPLGQGVAPGASIANFVQPYTFPENPRGGFIPFNQRGGVWNDDSIIKAQYQKNMGSNAYLRVYGYTFYSDWFNNDPNTINPFNGFCCVGAGLIEEYELFAHTRGASAQFADQLTPKNLLNVQASTVTSSVVRYNNSGSFFDNGEFALVNSSKPASGICYDPATGNSGDCFGIANSATAPFALGPGVTSVPAVGAGVTCGGSPCEWLAVESGDHGTYNTVKPTFNAYSITDQYQPFDKLLLNVGLRYESFSFTGPNTLTSNGSRPFWFAAYNNAYCASSTPGTGTVAAGFYGAGATTATCPAGTAVLNSSPALAITGGPLNNFYHELEPRVSGTYTLNTNNVLRFSYGRYAQPGDTSAEQYNAAQGDLPGGLLGPIFYPYGFHSSTHNIPPEVSNNYDLSWEHQIKGTDMSWKITPFWRATQGEQTSFFIDPLQAFVSTIPVGNLNSRGVEFAFQKGDFNRNGFAGQLAFTYTYTDIKYTALQNGGTPLSVINNDIAQFNAYTKGCLATEQGAAHNATCLTQGGTAPTNSAGNPIIAAACYDAGGVPDQSCTGAGAVANPYWNAPTNGLFNLSGPYLPTDTVVATTGLGANTYGAPYVATLLLNYKHDRFSITPSIQFEAGQRYGQPENTEGVDPMTCGGIAGSTLSGDPRYMGGTAGQGGLPYNAVSCTGALIAIPDAFNNNRYDQIGQFVAPMQLLANLQLSYDVSPKVTLQVTLANVYDGCFGGTSTAWSKTFGGTKTCSWVGTASAFEANPVGNFYNPGTAINRAFQYPYTPFPGVYNPNGSSYDMPFQVYFDARIKI